jgi:hypothetical protein
MIKLAPIARQILANKAVTIKPALTANERREIKQLLLGNERDRAKDRIRQLLIEKVTAAR